MKGIVLAGGEGTRLYPITKGCSKQLLPVYDKPMVYYPLSALMLAGIREILLIATPADMPAFKRLLGDGSQLGIELSYAEQPRPEGLAQAYLIGREFIGQDSVALVLGDNIFYGQNFRSILARVSGRKSGATVFAYHVTDPGRYGVIEFNGDGQAIGIEEKPEKPRSNYVIPGIYFCDNEVVGIAENLKPSKRGVLEITDVIQEYLRRGSLQVERFSRGFAWLDMGTKDSLLDAGNFVAAIEKRQGLKIACLEEIAYRQGYIDQDRLLQLVDRYDNEYGNYLRVVAAEEPE